MAAGRTGMRPRIVGGNTTPFVPWLLPNAELYLDSRLGLIGDHGDIVEPWPDQTINSRDAFNDTGGGNSGKMLLQTTSNTSPNGEQTVFFNGLDFPNAAVGGSISPNPWPTTARGYTFYAGFKPLGAASSSGLELLFNEGGAANIRVVPSDSSLVWTWRDNAGIRRDSNTSMAVGWQSWRGVISAAGVLDYFNDGVLATWQGGWNQIVTVTPGILSGYLIGNLSTNFVVGLHALIGWFVWYSEAHSLTLQRRIDNYLRNRFGLASI